MNKNKPSKPVIRTSTPVLKNSGLKRILKHAFPSSSIEDTSDDESYFVKSPKNASVKKPKRVFEISQSFRHENSGKKVKLSVPEPPETKTNSELSTSIKNLENVFIEKMQEKIKTIINSYPEISKAADTQNNLKKSMGKHQTLIKESIVMAMQHHKNINLLKEKMDEECKMFNKCVGAATNELSHLVNKSNNWIQYLNTVESSVGEVQTKIKNEGDIVSRKLWNEFIENYATTMNKRILSLME